MPDRANSKSSSGSPDPDHPFRCSTCSKRFTRQENLKRHAKLHSSSTRPSPILCETCPATFSRQDLYRRHIKNKHPELLPVTSAPNDNIGVDTGPPGTANEASTTTRPVLPSSFSSLPRIDGGHDADLSNDQDTIPTTLPRRSSLSTSRNDDQTNVLPLSVLSFASIHRPDHILPTDGDGNTDYDIDMADTGFEESRVNSPDPVTRSTNLHVDRLSSNDDNDHTNPTFVPMRLEPQPEPGLESEDISTARGIDLFFQHVCHHYSFIHRPTFDTAGSPRYLRLAMASLGLQYEDYDRDHSRSDIYDHSQDPNPKLGEAHRRSRRCYQAALDLAGRASKLVKDGSGKLAIVQTYLLLQACGMLYLGGEEAVQGGRLHFEMVSLCRSSGLFQPSPMDPTNTLDLESLWRHFIQSESHKRTIFALHHMDGVWYQIFSLPRLLSHLEIKHDMPCLDTVWAIETAADWAHYRLLASHRNEANLETMQYSESVRHMFDVPDLDRKHFSHLGLQGVMNVINFISSSLREVSGWSTMTGSVSMERPEMLRKPLAALGHVFDGLPPSQPGSNGRILVEATWRMAMLEMLSWSPSHMRGIVESSLEGAVATAAYLASTQDLIIHPEIKQSLIPHLEWFLLYLDDTVDVIEESPLVALYAWRAFLIAWQLLQQETSGGFGCMSVIGIQAGNSHAARLWVEDVFNRRRKWLIGQAVLRNIYVL